MHVRLESQPVTLLADPAWSEGLLAGRFVGELPLEEAAGHPHRVDLSLRASGDVLRGHALSVLEIDRAWFALPAYVELRRAESPDGAPLAPDAG